MDYEVHVSDIQQFLKCRRSWNWSSALRMGYEPALPFVPFYVGRAVHWAIEAHAMQGMSYEKAIDVFVENERDQMKSLDQDVIMGLEENLPLVRSMLEHYEMVWSDPEVELNDRDLEFLEVEQKFKIPLLTRGNDTIYMAGRLDGVVQRKSDRTFWIWETKTTRSIKELMGSLDLNLQIIVYLWAMREMDTFPVKGVLYNVLRKSAPAWPKVGATGLMSKAKSQKTSYHHYKHAIETHHANDEWKPEHYEQFYGDFLYYLRNEENDYFGRYLIQRDSERLDRTMGWLKAIAHDMTSPDLPIYPAPSWSACTFCSFQNPCRMTERGMDSNLIDSVFEVDYRHKVVSESLRVTEEVNNATN